MQYPGFAAGAWKSIWKSPTFREICSGAPGGGETAANAFADDLSVKKHLSKLSAPRIAAKQPPEEQASSSRGLSSSPLDALPPALPVYSRQEVAPIAARLLEGDDYPCAVDRANKLLQECDVQRQRNEAFHRSFDNSPLEEERKKTQAFPAAKIKAMALDEKWGLGFPVRFSTITKYALNVSIQAQAESSNAAVCQFLQPST